MRLVWSPILSKGMLASQSSKSRALKVGNFKVSVSRKLSCEAWKSHVQGIKRALMVGNVGNDHPTKAEMPKVT